MMSGATYKGLSNGATPAIVSVDFDHRPLLFSLERIAAAIEKVQLRVDIPELSPQIHLPAPLVVEKAPACVTVTPANVAPPTILVKTPVWPSVVLILATLVQISAALGLFK